MAISHLDARNSCNVNGKCIQFVEVFNQHGLSEILQSNKVVQDATEGILNNNTIS